MKGPRVLTAIVAMFTASWRFSNWTVRAGNHRNKWVVRIEAEVVRMVVFLKIILPATMALDSTNHAQVALASSSVVRRAA